MLRMSLRNGVLGCQDGKKVIFQTEKFFILYGTEIVKHSAQSFVYSMQIEWLP